MDTGYVEICVSVTLSNGQLSRTYMKRTTHLVCDILLYDIVYAQTNW